MIAPRPIQERLPLVLFEDEHLLVVNKPAGMNTHAPSPFAGEGIYDWLRHREPRCAALAIIHRLDKETSGVLLFSKSPSANRSLTEQFARHLVRKKYVLLTDRPAPEGASTIVSFLSRIGDKYVSRPASSGTQRAETRFRSLGHSGGMNLLAAEPVTGRTHQIRVQAAEQGFPILGDVLYGGTAASRLFLHAEELSVKHPISGRELTFHAPSIFGKGQAKDLPDPVYWRSKLRSALLDEDVTNAYRLFHGATDGLAEIYVDRFDRFLLAQSAESLSAKAKEILTALGAHSFSQRGTLEGATPQSLARAAIAGGYHKLLARKIGGKPAEVSPQLVFGNIAPERFLIRENAVQYELSFSEGYSVGLFLDQRDNRRRILLNHVAANFPWFTRNISQAEVLNTFAYTCGFSVCAALAGARTTSIDLSRKYLDWGKRNFAANQLDPANHQFLQGDVFDWLRRLGKKQRRFALIILDPPTFSRSNDGVFQAEKDYGKLVLAAIPLLRSKGVLFASSNAAGWAPEKFLDAVRAAIRKGGRRIAREHYAPQPPDFPISWAEPGYLKTVWIGLE
jgi:23S rRNA (cytosine1962-C5)-methyltransferase